MDGQIIVCCIIFLAKPRYEGLKPENRRLGNTVDLREYALAIMREQIQQQFQTSTALDNKASWLLGFLAVVFTVFFATQKSKIGHDWLVTIGVLLLASFILSVVSLIIPISLRMSPGIKAFRDFVEENADDPEATTRLEKLLSEDHVGDFDSNKKKLRVKKAVLYSGYVVLLAALITMAIKAR